MSKQLPIETPVLTLEEAAEYLRVHPSTVYRMIRANGLPWFKLGSDYRFDRRAIDEWTKQRTMKVRR